MRAFQTTRLFAPCLAILVSAALVQTSEARKVQGFEPGDPAITSIGDAGTQGTYQGEAPPEGTLQYLMTTVRAADAEDGVTHQSGSDAVAFAPLNAFFFNNVVSNQDGSGILIPFTVLAGDSNLTFQYDFLSNEPAQSTPRNDFAFAGLFNSAGVLQGSIANFVNQTSATNLFGAQIPFQFHSGYQTMTLSLAGLSPGSYQLGIGVSDATNTSHASALLVDNVQVNSAVPEPSTIGLLIAGAVSCMAVRRRLKK